MILFIQVLYSIDDEEAEISLILLSKIYFYIY
jgi:hypothetical protein